MSVEIKPWLIKQLMKSQCSGGHCNQTCISWWLMSIHVGWFSGRNMFLWSLISWQSDTMVWFHISASSSICCTSAQINYANRSRRPPVSPVLAAVSLERLQCIVITTGSGNSVLETQVNSAGGFLSVVAHSAASVLGLAAAGSVCECECECMWVCECLSQPHCRAQTYGFLSVFNLS